VQLGSPNRIKRFKDLGGLVGPRKLMEVKRLRDSRGGGGLTKLFGKENRQACVEDVAVITYCC